MNFHFWCMVLLIVKNEIFVLFCVEPRVIKYYWFWDWAARRWIVQPRIGSVCRAALILFASLYFCLSRLSFCQDLLAKVDGWG